MHKLNYYAYCGLAGVALLFASLTLLAGCQSPFGSQTSVDLSSYGITAISAAKSSDEAVAAVSYSGTTLTATSLSSGTTAITVTCTGSTGGDFWTDSPVSISAAVDSTGAVSFGTPDTSKALKATVAIPKGMSGKTIDVPYEISDEGTLYRKFSFTSDTGGTYADYSPDGSVSVSEAFTYDESTGAIPIASQTIYLLSVNDSQYLQYSSKYKRTLGKSGIAGEHFYGEFMQGVNCYIVIKTDGSWYVSTSEDESSAILEGTSIKNSSGLIKAAFSTRDQNGNVQNGALIWAYDGSSLYFWSPAS